MTEQEHAAKQKIEKAQADLVQFFEQHGEEGEAAMFDKLAKAMQCNSEDAAEAAGVPPGLARASAAAFQSVAVAMGPEAFAKWCTALHEALFAKAAERQVN